MKKCVGCESLIPETYTVCPKCSGKAFKEHKRHEPTKAKPVQVTKEDTFGASVMACHSHIKPT